MAEMMTHANIFRRAHAGHRSCLRDEWLARPCPAPHYPLVWSRRNGPWRPVDVLFVGAAPGNAGGRGAGDMGAHATRIPFGGDVAGANLDVLLASAGLTRDDVFIVAALNRLPDAGGGEPTARELAEPVGAYASSLHLLRDTMLATRPKLLVALGNVGLRATIGAARLEASASAKRSRGGALPLPSLESLRRTGLERGAVRAWPDAFAPDESFSGSLATGTADDGSAATPKILWLTHPSAQNMSPYAGEQTLFHARMVEARDALRSAVREVLAMAPPRRRPDVPLDGGGRPDSVYDLPEWRDAIGPRHRELDFLWRAKNV